MFSIKQTVSAFNQATSANQYTMFHVPAIQELLNENERLKQENERLLGALLKHIEKPQRVVDAETPQTREPCCVFSWNKQEPQPNNPNVGNLSHKTTCGFKDAVLKQEIVELPQIKKEKVEDEKIKPYAEGLSFYSQQPIGGGIGIGKYAFNPDLVVSGNTDFLKGNFIVRGNTDFLKTPNYVLNNDFIVRGNTCLLPSTIEAGKLFELSKKASEFLYLQPTEPTKQTVIKETVVETIVEKKSTPLSNISAVIVEKVKEDVYVEKPLEEEEGEYEEVEEEEEEGEETTEEEQEVEETTEEEEIEVEETTEEEEIPAVEETVVIEPVVEEEEVEYEEEEVEEEEEEEEPEYESIVLDGVEYFIIENHGMADGTEIFAVVKNQDGDEELGDKVGVLQNKKLVKPTPPKKKITAKK